jgi:carbamoyltransferase
MKQTHILGISAFYHDSAAAIVRDGVILAAAQEERFSRIKGDPSFPMQAVAHCLDAADISEHELNHVVFYENPVVKFERLTEVYHLSAPKSMRSFLTAFPSWLTSKLWQDREIARALGVRRPIHFCDHHLSHAASAFYPSPYEEAAILTIDGVGEWSTATYGVGHARGIELIKEIRFPNSLGLLYSAFTYYTGFKINSGEYKLMGLAPYGEPKYAGVIMKELVDMAPDGAIRLNQKYFDFIGGLTMTSDAFAELFGGPPREAESLITQREMDLAASIQAVLNDAVCRMARHVRKETGMKHLVLAGGVALNVVATGLLARQRVFDGIWIQPAAGDAGGALGAALWMWHDELRAVRRCNGSDAMKGSFLGLNIEPGCAHDDEILRRLGANWILLDETELASRIADLIAQGNVVAIARGRAEWGPRALGARSILGDARSPKMQSHMNLKIKFRESFRPFAPMVLAEKASDYFDITQESPYMLFAFPVLECRRIALQEDQKSLWGIDLLNVPKSDIPAVTHVDYSARVQTVDKERNAFIHEVISKFEQRTGIAVVINTSFNVRSEPIVNTPEDAYRCFMATDIDALVIGNRLLLRQDQESASLTEEERAKWLGSFDLD